ncbi:MAG: AAA family ATPase [Haloplanus sp.]
MQHQGRRLRHVRFVVDDEDASVGGRRRLQTGTRHHRAFAPKTYRTADRSGSRRRVANRPACREELGGRRRKADVIVILCGPPGAGKTTLATRLRDRLAARGYEFSLLHSDDFSRRTYERMYARVGGSDDDWILDGTFYRREWQERFRALDDTHVVWVTAPVETCLARNRTRAAPISETGVHVVHAEFADPAADLVVDTDARSVEAALDRLETAILGWIEA